MNMRIIILLIATALSFFHCMGPALSQHYACEHDKQMPFEGYFFCMFSASKNISQQERENYMILCANYQKRYKDYCKGESSIQPWWIQDYRHSYPGDL